jgi:hypothetical protein
VVGKRSKHLAHPKPATDVAAEAGFAVGDCNLQRYPGVLQARIIRMGTQTRQHADATIADYDFERAGPRRESDKAGVRGLAVAEDIVLEFAERADDFGCDPRREAGGEGRLVGATRPELPKIGPLAVSAQPAKREDARLCILLYSSHSVMMESSLNGRDKGGFEHHRRESLRVSLSSSDQLDQRTDLPRALNANRPQVRQLAIRRGKKQFVGGVEVADQRLPRLLRPLFHLPPSSLQLAPADWPPGRAPGPLTASLYIG